jgi:hypothetical protein
VETIWQIASRHSLAMTRKVLTQQQQHGHSEELVQEEHDPHKIAMVLAWAWAVLHGIAQHDLAPTNRSMFVVSHTTRK